MKTMRRADLIELTRDEDDARRVYVSATRTAKGLLRRYDAASEDILTTALSTPLSPAERKAIEAAIPALSKLQSIAAAPRDRIARGVQLRSYLDRCSSIEEVAMSGGANSRPAWATEPVSLADADPAWALRGEQERDHLEGATGTMADR